MPGLRLRIVLIAGAGLALTGCAWLRPMQHLAANLFPHMVKITPVSAHLDPVAPNALDDRLYAQAVRALEARDYAAALEALQLAHATRADDPRVLNAMAVVYDKLGRFELSQRYYDLAEKADPGSRIVAANRRYSLLLRQGGLVASAGVTSVSSLQSIPPGLADDPRRMADRLYAGAVREIQQRDYGAALVTLQTAQTASHDDPRILNALGVIYDKLGRFDLSGRYYDLAEKADPGSKVVAANRRYSDMLRRRGGPPGDERTPVVVDPAASILASAPASIPVARVDDQNHRGPA